MKHNVLQTFSISKGRSPQASEAESVNNKVHPTLRAYSSSSESSEADDEPFIDPPLPSNCSEGAMSACKVEYSVVKVFSPADGSGGNRAAVVQTQERLEVEAMARIARCASSHALPPPSPPLSRFTLTMTPLDVC